MFSAPPRMASNGCVRENISMSLPMPPCEDGGRVRCELVSGPRGDWRASKEKRKRVYLGQSSTPEDLDCLLSDLAGDSSGVHLE
jgi:hypothetical protein